VSENSAGPLFSRQRPDGEARRRRISSLDLRLRSNKARRPLARKPSGRRVFCPWPALARSLQPALGMLGPRRLGHSQNPSPQDPAQFSDTLLERHTLRLSIFTTPAKRQNHRRLGLVQSLRRPPLRLSHRRHLPDLSNRQGQLLAVLQRQSPDLVQQSRAVRDG